MTLLSERNVQNKLRFHQNLFTLALIILIIKNMTDSSGLFKKPMWLDNLMVMTFILVIGIKLFTQSYTYARFIAFLLLWVLCAYTCITCKYYYLVYSSLTVCAMQDVDLTKTLAVTCRIKALILAVHTSVYVWDLFFQPWLVTYSYRDNVRRMTFFMGHANTFSMYVCWTLLEYLYSRYKKMHMIELVVVWGINTLVYAFCDSNSSMIIMTFVCLLTFFSKKLKGTAMKVYEAVITFEARYLYAFLSGFFIVLIIGYVNGLFSALFMTLSDLFTGRLLFGAIAYDMKGVSLIGKAISFPEKLYWRGHWIDSMVFDNCYIWMFVCYGVVYLILISAVFMRLGKKMTLIDKIFIVSYALYTMMEAYVMNTGLVFPLLILGPYIMASQGKEVNRAAKKEVKRYE